MSITNLILISDALRLLNVINETETPSAEQGATALRVLNQMMEQMDEDGLHLQYYEQTATSGTFPCPAYSHVGLTAALAIRVAPFFGASVAPEVLSQYSDGMATIYRKSALKSIRPAELTHVPLGQIRKSANIETDQ